MDKNHPISRDPDGGRDHGLGEDPVHRDVNLLRDCVPHRENESGGARLGR